MSPNGPPQGGGGGQGGGQGSAKGTIKYPQAQTLKVWDEARLRGLQIDFVRRTLTAQLDFVKDGNVVDGDAFVIGPDEFDAFVGDVPGAQGQSLVAKFLVAIRTAGRLPSGGTLQES